MKKPRRQIETIVVTAAQMREIEELIFQAGMPVAALMEKVATLITTRITELCPFSQSQHVGVLVGPGHNGGDALVIARELHLKGYKVSLYRPLEKLKELTNYHAKYAENLAIDTYQEISYLSDCQLIIDGLFGFGLTRNIAGKIATDIEQLNQWSQPVISIDIPSGIHTDTGKVLGTAVRANRTLCLGLWKQAFLQDQALEYLGKTELIDFDIPIQNIQAVIGKTPTIKRMTVNAMQKYLPLPRPLLTHKYQQGHLLLIGSSQKYAGSIILAGLAARASGVGMLSIAIPQSLKPILVSHLPDALIIGCLETEFGAIAQLPPQACELDNFTTIACGPGLTLDAHSVVQQVLASQRPLVLDADGLNILAQLGTQATLVNRPATTVLTPHLGEFRRLFPQITNPHQDRIRVAQQAARESGAVILLKGARSAIAAPNGSVWLVPESTPALARGGSGDVLTGLIGGLIAQKAATEQPVGATVATAAWWHAQAGILAAQERTELGVDALSLSQYLAPALPKNWV